MCFNIFPRIPDKFGFLTSLLSNPVHPLILKILILTINTYRLSVKKVWLESNDSELTAEN